MTNICSCKKTLCTIWCTRLVRGFSKNTMFDDLADKLLLRCFVFFPRPTYGAQTIPLSRLPFQVGIPSLEFSDFPKKKRCVCDAPYCVGTRLRDLHKKSHFFRHILLRASLQTHIFRGETCPTQGGNYGPWFPGDRVRPDRRFGVGVAPPFRAPGGNFFAGCSWSIGYDRPRLAAIGVCS